MNIGTKDPLGRIADTAITPEATRKYNLYYFRGLRKVYQRVFLCTLWVCTLGLGSLNHGIRPEYRYLGPPHLGLQTLRVQT